jgi:transposase-like protein
MALKRTRMTRCQRHYDPGAAFRTLERLLMTKRTFGREFKLQVVRQLARGEKRISQVCREHGLCQTLVRRWREQYAQEGENAWLPSVGVGAVEADQSARIAALEGALGRAHLELDFLRHSLATLRKGGLPPVNNGR